GPYIGPGGQVMYPRDDPNADLTQLPYIGPGGVVLYPRKPTAPAAGPAPEAQGQAATAMGQGYSGAPTMDLSGFVDPRYAVGAAPAAVPSPEVIQAIAQASPAVTQYYQQAAQQAVSPWGINIGGGYN